MNFDYNTAMFISYACLISFVGGFGYGYFIGFFAKHKISIKKGVMKVENMEEIDEIRD